MHRTRFALSAALAVSMAWGCCTAWAAGFGVPSASAWLGQPLDYAVPLRLDPGDALEPACVKAAVSLGERSLPPTQVATRLDLLPDGQARVHVLTTVPVDEPIVVIQLDIACGLQLARRFVVLADPPGLERLPSVAAQPVRTALALVAAPALATATAAAPLSAGTAQEGPAAATGTPPGRITPRSAPGSPPRSSPSGPAAPRAAAAGPGQAGPGPRSASPAAAPRPATVAAARPAVPRLRLDVAPALPAPAAAPAAQLQMVEDALAAVATATTALRSAQAAASAAEARALGLERTAQQLRAEAQAQGQAAGLMRERLSSSEAVSNWVWPLMVGVLGLTGLCAWLAWQLAALRRERERGWQQAAAAAQAAGATAGAEALAQSGVPARAGPATGPGTLGRAWAAPSTTPATAAASLAPDNGAPSARMRGQGSPGTPPWPAAALGGDTQPHALQTAPLPARAALDEPPAALPAGPPGSRGAAGSMARNEPTPSTQQILPLPPAQHTMGLGGAGPGAGGLATARDLSIEELIDLEQQAEFFIVLGQDEAAIDLLVEHIRSTAGVSPLPYLKLLEIYRRQDAREAYERTRTRFNQRFNAYAPDWAADPAQGRRLEDYPEVMPRLLYAWPRPLDAMAELEALLFRKTHGELFELPAYRELLFLYALARDLLDREAADTGNVDLLLPLADGGDFGVTMPHPYFGHEHESVFNRQAGPDTQAASGVDLDLSQVQAEERIFDPLTSTRLPGRAD